MRFDHFITLYIYKHMMKILPKPKGIQIPILMYHSISDEKESAHPYYWINTSPKRFYEHMKFLKLNNYKVISLTEAANIISKTNYLKNSINPINPKNSINSINSGNTMNSSNLSNSSNPSNLVVLTFDDGYHDFYTTAWPILSQFGFPATVFLPTAFIGGYFKNRQCLSWSEICELHNYGVSFGSHTVTHPQLHDLSWQEIGAELGNSKNALEDHMGVNVGDFSYPYAYPEADRIFCKRLASTLLEYGYNHCVTTRLGCSTYGDDVFNLRRLPINSADGLSLFKAKLEGHYDWLAISQRLIKILKWYVRHTNTFQSK